MKYLHTMIRIKDVDESLDFFTNKLGLTEIRRRDDEKGRYTNIFLSTNQDDAELELTYNWDNEDEYSIGRNFGHLAYEVENIYEFCEELEKKDVVILRPPRDGKMAFIKSPDNVSIELLQKGELLELKEPWISMENKGYW